MSTKKKTPDENTNQASKDSPEESLKKLIENSKTKSEAYKKILKSLNINKNRD